MLDVKKEDYEFGRVITLSNNEKSFDIMFGGNGDLYFSPTICGKKLLEEIDPIVFTISEVDQEIYPLFLRLYNKIVEYSPYDYEESPFRNNNPDENSQIEREKDKYRKHPLAHDGIISWHSDEDYEDVSSILNIKMENNKIILEFIKSHPEDSMYETYCIRFRNSGSRYAPFNCRFMELYNTLCEIDFTYHQITIAEYMQEKQHTQEKTYKKDK